MSIDYDRLGQQLEDFDQAETFHAKWVALEAIRVNAVATARELLRLLDSAKTLTVIVTSVWARGKVKPSDLHILEASGAPIPEWAHERAPTGEVTIQHLITYWAHLDLPAPDDCPPDIHQPGWQLDEYGDRFAGVLAGRVWVTDPYGWGGSYAPEDIRTAAHKLLAAAEEAEQGRL